MKEARELVGDVVYKATTGGKSDPARREYRECADRSSRQPCWFAPQPPSRLGQSLRVRRQNRLRLLSSASAPVRLPSSRQDPATAATRPRVLLESAARQTRPSSRRVGRTATKRRRRKAARRRRVAFVKQRGRVRSARSHSRRAPRAHLSRRRWAGRKNGWKTCGVGERVRGNRRVGRIWSRSGLIADIVV